jgi:hypothetical protein
MGLLLIWYRFPGKKQSVLAAMLCASLVAVPASIHGYDAFSRASYPLPQAHVQFVRVCFEQEHSDFALPTTSQAFAADVKRQFLTFFVWNQRLDYVPALENSLENALEKGDVVVFINPAKPFDEREKALIAWFVERGGKILLLDGMENTAPASNQVLDLFGMHINYVPLKDDTLFVNGSLAISLTGQACSVAGGEAVLRNGGGEAVFARAGRGEGTVAVFTDSSLFSNAVMGDTSMLPTAYQQAIGRLEFWIMQGLAEGRFGTPVLSTVAGEES